MSENNFALLDFKNRCSLKSVMHLKPINERGWIKRRVALRPRTRLFAVLSILWCLVSLSPAGLLMHHEVASLSALGIFLWAIILLNPIFLVLALYFRLTEPKRVFEQRIPDPNYDLWRED